MPELLSIDAATQRILTFFNPLPGESVPLMDALGRVLAQDVTSDTPLPPFANSSMDGFAIRASESRGASAETPVMLRVVFDIPAGSTPDRQLGIGEAARIMTGAPLPEGADAVIPVEQTDQHWSAGTNPPLPERVAIHRELRPGDYVRNVGEDLAAGQVVLRAGTVIRPPELGILASLGYDPVSVVRKPRVAIVTTGDELVEVNQPLAPGKIRDSNSYTLAGLVTSYGGIPIRIPIARDTIDDVRRRFREALDAQPDIVISSAGVSVGAYDVVRAVLTELGEINFWRVNLRPGKPLAFGMLNGVPFFGLPGNPVSAMVTFDVFVRPALLKLTHRPDEAATVQAAIAEPLTSDGRRSYLRVQLRRENGRLVATTTGTQSSSAIMSMVLADGLLIVPENVTSASAGDMFSVRLLRSIDGI